MPLVAHRRPSSASGSLLERNRGVFGPLIPAARVWGIGEDPLSLAGPRRPERR